MFEPVLFPLGAPGEVRPASDIDRSASLVSGTASRSVSGSTPMKPGLSFKDR